MPRITVVEMSLPECIDWITSGFIDEQLGGADGTCLVLLTGDIAELPPPGSLPVVLAYIGDALGAVGPEHADLVVGATHVDHLVRMVTTSPLAATSLVVLLRAVPDTDVDTALGLESATYSMLQAGPEFTRWRAGASHRADTDTEPCVLIDRVADSLTITLNRPHRHNAISANLRDALYDALRLAYVDESITAVTLRGRGASFSSGGDLAEFGTFPDVVTAHHTRLSRSPARLAAQLSRRLEVHLHGVAMGGGLELAAFARRLTATTDTLFGLPELGLGLIPGAGGTVSITQRIGRQRTAALALAVEFIDAATALTWGLIDDIVDTAPHHEPGA
jgi:enoyl-CoA hydratase/carnithine racemase